MTTPSGPPTPPRRSDSHTAHGVVREDPWSGLREVDSPEVLGHLVAERSWYDVATGHLHPLVEDLHAEMVARTPGTDSSVNWLRGAFSYYTRVPTGREHVQLLRDLHPTSDRNQSLAADSATETVLLDLNVEAAGSSYAELGLTRVSPDHRLLAWSVDLVGDEVYRLRFRDLETGEDLAEEVPRSYYSGAWSADSRHFFYTVHDGAYRPFQVRRHEIGTPVEDDVLVLEEPDERFELQVRATRSGGLVVIWARSRDTTEVWVVDAADPTSPARSVGGRRPGVE
jgi:oligopeptidase B